MVVANGDVYVTLLKSAALGQILRIPTSILVYHLPFGVKRRFDTSAQLHKTRCTVFRFPSTCCT